MPFNISGRKPRLLALTAGLAALIATPAHAAGKIANPYDCAPQPTLAQNFAAWNDYGQYTPVRNAGLEDGAAGWTLSGGASVVAGNEPWKIGGGWHRNALDLPAGSSAITAPICIDETYPHFRLFARNTGSLKGALKIEVLYFDTKGNIVNTKPYDYKTATTGVAADRPSRNQRLLLQDDRRSRARRLPLHPHHQGRALPDRRRLRRPPRPRLATTGQLVRRTPRRRTSPTRPPSSALPMLLPAPGRPAMPSRRGSACSACETGRAASSPFIATDDEPRASGGQAAHRARPRGSSAAAPRDDFNADLEQAETAHRCWQDESRSQIAHARREPQSAFVRRWSRHTAIELRQHARAQTLCRRGSPSCTAATTNQADTGDNRVLRRARMRLSAIWTAEAHDGGLSRSRTCAWLHPRCPRREPALATSCATRSKRRRCRALFGRRVSGRSPGESQRFTARHGSELTGSCGFAASDVRRAGGSPRRPSRQRGDTPAPARGGSRRAGRRRRSRRVRGPARRPGGVPPVPGGQAARA